MVGTRVRPIQSFKPTLTAPVQIAGERPLVRAIEKTGTARQDTACRRQGSRPPAETKVKSNAGLHCPVLEIVMETARKKDPRDCRCLLPVTLGLRIWVSRIKDHSSQRPHRKHRPGRSRRPTACLARQLSLQVGEDKVHAQGEPAPARKVRPTLIAACDGNGAPDRRRPHLQGAHHHEARRESAPWGAELALPVVSEGGPK